MDLTSLKELGIAGVSVGALAWICFQLIKQLGEARNNYQSFVQDNNHTTTELVKEATSTLVQVKDCLENHNKVLEKLLDKVDCK